MKKIIIISLALILALGLVVSCKQDPAAQFYTVTFDKNNDKVMGEMNPQLMKPDTETALNPNQYIPEVAWEFEGWSTTKDGEVEYKDEAKIKITSDLTLYAKWQKEKVTIEFDANGGTGEMADQIVDRRTLEALSKNEFKRAGFTFLGWSEEDDATLPDYVDEDEDEFDEDLKLYAVWQAQLDNTAWEYVVGETPVATVVFKDVVEKEKTTKTISISIPAYSILLEGTYSVLGGENLMMFIGDDGAGAPLRYAYIGPEEEDDIVIVSGDAGLNPTKEEFVRDFYGNKYYFPEDYMAITDPYETETKYSVDFIEVDDVMIYTEAVSRSHGELFSYYEARAFKCSDECPALQHWDYKIPDEYTDLIIITSAFEYDPGKSISLFLEIEDILPFDVYEFTPILEK